MEIGRNDPCPCGSGKKYKKCCLNKPAEIARPVDDPASRSESRDDDVIITHYPGDYGVPRLDDRLFDALQPEELSAYGLVWNIAKRPDIAEQAAKISRGFIFRGKEEARRIKKAGSGEELVRIILENPDPINHHLLLERVVDKAPDCIPLIIFELATPHRTNFAELAVKAIYRSNYYPEEELLALVTEPNATAYDLSLICMLLGMIELEEAIKPLWDYYRFFKREFPREDYWKGPLTGLEDIKYAQDHPIEVSEAERQLVEKSLREAGILLPGSDAELIVRLIRQHRIIKVVRMLVAAGGEDRETNTHTLTTIMKGLVQLKSDSTDH